MGRIQGLDDTLAMTGSQLLKTGPGFLFSVTFTWRGATVGDVIYFRDGVDGTSSKVIVAFACPTANGTISREWSQGKPFTDGLFYDEGTPANAFVEATFK